MSSLEIQLTRTLGTIREKPGCDSLIGQAVFEPSLLDVQHSFCSLPAEQHSLSIPVWDILHLIMYMGLEEIVDWLAACDGSDMTAHIWRLNTTAMDDTSQTLPSHAADNSLKTSSLSR